MENSGIIATIVVVVIIMVVIWILLLRSSRRVNLTQTKDGEQPQWMHTAPPPETIAETQADGEGMALYDYDQGENLAAPFAEQIEDILHQQLRADPDLRSRDVDLGTGPDGGLEISVDGEHYRSIQDIPDERLRAALNRAVAIYNQQEK